jgi:hypothetical protein
MSKREQIEEIWRLIGAITVPTDYDLDNQDRSCSWCGYRSDSISEEPDIHDDECKWLKFEKARHLLFELYKEIREEESDGE